MIKNWWIFGERQRWIIVSEVIVLLMFLVVSLYYISWEIKGWIWLMPIIGLLVIPNIAIVITGIQDNK